MLHKTSVLNKYLQFFLFFSFKKWVGEIFNSPTTEKTSNAKISSEPIPSTSKLLSPAPNSNKVKTTTIPIIQQQQQSTTKNDTTKILTNKRVNWWTELNITWHRVGTMLDQHIRNLLKLRNINQKRERYNFNRK